MRGEIDQEKIRLYEAALREALTTGLTLRYEDFESFLAGTILAEDSAVRPQLMEQFADERDTYLIAICLQTPEVRDGEYHVFSAMVDGRETLVYLQFFRRELLERIAATMRGEDWDEEEET